MIVGKPIKSNGLLMGVFLGALFFVIYIGGVQIALEGGALKWTLLLPAYLFLVLYIYLLVSKVTMKYILTDTGLQISWAFSQTVIPFDEIQDVSVVTGRVNLVNILGASWPGFMIGMYELRGVGPAKFYASDVYHEILMVRTRTGLTAITPDADFANALADAVNTEIGHIDTYEIHESEIGEIIDEDLGYMVLLGLNIIVIATLCVYLAIFFPGSAAPRISMLFLPLAVGLFVFNMVNASRIFHYAKMGAYGIWLIQLMVSIGFLVADFSTIGFK
ncbi:MAG: PH domain-containing protein [Solirubrobacterales bacterium]